MISVKCTAKPSASLQRKLSRDWMEQNVSELTDAVANGILWNIKEYGIGVASSVLAYPTYEGAYYSRSKRTPSGGAPIWQGKITQPGHYRGYLSESHYVKKTNASNSSIMTSADFVWGVIYGYSTNADEEGNATGVFPPNPYHKRAVDKFISEGKIPIIWKNIINR